MTGRAPIGVDDDVVVAAALYGKVAALLGGKGKPYGFSSTRSCVTQASRLYALIKHQAEFYARFTLYKTPYGFTTESVILPLPGSAHGDMVDIRDI